MKTVSLTVSEADYEAFRRAARDENRPIAQLIREAMTFYRQAKLEVRTPLSDLPVLVGHRAVTALPERAELYEEVFAERD
ncbi:hypothetical protein BH24DEI1_BH24DEI1_01980 [soil metagenome]|jgi:hypothetical protein|nr:ribbon-helix-helix protein, CopG family [Deinococcota bacterium]